MYNLVNEHLAHIYWRESTEMVFLTACLNTRLFKKGQCPSLGQK